MKKIVTGLILFACTMLVGIASFASCDPQIIKEAPFLTEIEVIPFDTLMVVDYENVSINTETNLIESSLILTCNNYLVIDHDIIIVENKIPNELETDIVIGNTLLATNSNNLFLHIDPGDSNELGISLK